MSDYIKREDAIGVLMGTITPPSITLDTLTMRMDNIPSADVVEVVRCKGCKHRFPTERQYRACSGQTLLIVTAYGCEICGIDTTKGDGYCSYGERKDEENEEENQRDR